MKQVVSNSTATRTETTEAIVSLVSDGRRVKNAWAFFTRYVDPRMAVMGALFLGGAVFAINFFDHGALGASTAAAKQALYTFFVGGFVTRSCERMAVCGPHRWRSIGLGSVVASVIAIGLTLLLHGIRGTPEPLWSTLPTVVSAPPAFLAWGIRKRRQQLGGTN